MSGRTGEDRSISTSDPPQIASGQSRAKWTFCPRAELTRKSSGNPSGRAQPRQERPLLADQFQAAADRARTLAQLEDLSRLFGAPTRKAMSTMAGQGPSARPWRPAAPGSRPEGPSPCRARSARRRRPPRSPDRRASIERRRRKAASGAMPPALAAKFTTGEAAVLAVIAREVQRSGRCEFYLDKICALAGVCRSTAQNALARGAPTWPCDGDRAAPARGEVVDERRRDRFGRVARVVEDRVQKFRHHGHRF